MDQKIKIIFEAEQFLIIDKPSRMFVHPPPTGGYQPGPHEILLTVFRKQFGKRIFPVHRLDYGTSGLLMVAKERDWVDPLANLFREGKIEKTYQCVVRGFLDGEGVIDRPLKVNFGNEEVPALTRYRCLRQIELLVAVGKRYPTSRYSLIEASPITGKWHQLRRHFDQIAHPIIGDIDHGDTDHNRFFRDQLKIQGLLLRAKKLTFRDPWSQHELRVEASDVAPWDRVDQLFQNLLVLT